MSKNSVNERAVTIIGASGVGLALVCVTLLAAFVSLDPKHMDRDLQSSLNAFTLALPALATAGFFGIWARNQRLAFAFLTGGSAVLIQGVYELLQHFDSADAVQFAVMTGLCFAVVIGYSVWAAYIRPKTRTEVAQSVEQRAE